MTYDSPKQIRRRQQAAENKVNRPRRQQTIKVSTEEAWGRNCDFHLKQIEGHGRADRQDAVVRHVQAMVQGAIYRRACQMMPKYSRSYLAVVEMARIELLGKEPE
jgi:hypothetical protein